MCIHLRNGRHDPCERIVAATRVQGDATAWEAAYAEGRRMTLEQAAAYALSADEPV
jgi:hypothetical protein